MEMLVIGLLIGFVGYPIIVPLIQKLVDKVQGM